MVAGPTPSRPSPAPTRAEEEVLFIKRKELLFEANHASTGMVSSLPAAVSDSGEVRSKPSPPRRPPSQLLGDVDGDGQHELVIGALDGSLAIFKVGCCWPHRTLSPATAQSRAAHHAACIILHSAGHRTCRPLGDRHRPGHDSSAGARQGLVQIAWSTAGGGDGRRRGARV